MRSRGTVVKVNPSMTEERITRRISHRNNSFENACVQGWEPLFEMTQKRTNPPITFFDLLEALAAAGVPQFSREVRLVLEG